MKWTLRFVCLMVCGALTIGCGSSLNKDLDDAREALNNGDWATAITKATAATQADSANLEAFLLLSSAYSGRGGVDLLEITKKLTDTGNSTTAFSKVHDTLVTTLSSTGLADMRTAITTLSTSFTGTITNYADYLQKEYYFQLGILQYIEALGLPTMTAQPTSGATITNATLTNIDATANTNVQTDFINGFANLTNTKTGISTGNSLVTTLSKNYCVLKNSSVTAGTASGINAGVLRDLALCQLATDAATACTTGAPTGYACTVANCAALNFNACDGTAVPAL